MQKTDLKNIQKFLRNKQKLHIFHNYSLIFFQFFVYVSKPIALFLKLLSASYRTSKVSQIGLIFFYRKKILVGQNLEKLF